MLISDNNNEYYFDLKSLTPYFDLKSPSKRIWESFNENLNKLNFNDMTRAQMNECNFIKEFVSCLLYKEFQCKTEFYSIQKRTFNDNPCYVLMFRCTVYICSSSWKILVDVDKREAHFSSYRSCQHKAMNGKLSI